METVWATIKREVEHIRGTLIVETLAEARAFLFDYIGIFYNRQRRHSALGMLAPIEFESRSHRPTAA